MDQMRLSGTILLQVMQYSDVPTIQNLRLTSRVLYDLINTYETTVCSTVLKRCYDDLELHQYRPLYCSKASIRSLIQLHNRVKVVRWLAGVAVEHHDDRLPGESYPKKRSENISAQDPRGDLIRARVEVGWSLLWRLADIAKMVKADNQHVGLDNVHQQQKLDALVHKHRLNFVKDLPFRERMEFMIMLNFLVPAFWGLKLHDRNYFKPGDEEDPGDYEDELDLHGRHWLAWIWLEKGPLFFQNAWASQEGNEKCLLFIEHQWRSRTDEELRFRYKAVDELLLALRDGEDTDEQREDEFGYVIRALTEFEDDPRQPVGGFKNIPYHIGPLT
ncbi:MAG: hypothetical protein Q9191_001696 [Dirinaria sp. TL-2023a]